MSGLPSNRAASLQSDEISMPEKNQMNELMAKLRDASHQTLVKLAYRYRSVDQSKEQFRQAGIPLQKVIVQAGEKCPKTCAQIMRDLEEADAVQISKTNPKGNAQTCIAMLTSDWQKLSEDYRHHLRNWSQIHAPKGQHLGLSAMVTLLYNFVGESQLDEIRYLMSSGIILSLLIGCNLVLYSPLIIDLIIQALATGFFSVKLLWFCLKVIIVYTAKAISCSCTCLCGSVQYCCIEPCYERFCSLWCRTKCGNLKNCFSECIKSVKEYTRQQKEGCRDKFNRCWSQVWRKKKVESEDMGEDDKDRKMEPEEVSNNEFNSELVDSGKALRAQRN